MLYAQFYDRNSSGKLAEACGDRSVIILDGRYSNDTNGKISAEECSKRGYLAWRVFKGDSFTRSKPVSQLWFVHNSREDISSMSATFGA